MNPSSMPLHRALLRVATAFLAVALEASAGLAATLPNPSQRQLAEVERLLAKHYVRVIPHDSLEAAARRCFSGGLDPYTRWLDPAESKDYETLLAGKLGGIGASFQYDTTAGVMRVESLIRDAPAIRAGLQIGDTLVAIDGHLARSLPLDDLIFRIRGKPGTTVRLQMHRAGEPRPVERTIRRAVVELLSVRGFRPAATEERRYLADERTRTAYIRIENFTARTPMEFDSALAAVRRVHAGALVLDLRDDGGGLLGSTEAVADRFLDSGVIVTVSARNDREVRRADREVSTRLPLAVLVNSNTASAAEVLAACLQDHHRAIVVGTRSYGKGAVQSLFHLRRSRGLLKLTIALYERPSGAPMERHIPGIGSERGGVWPDSGLVVPLSRAEEERWREASYLTTSRMSSVVAEADTSAEPRDRALERAIQALRSREAATSSRSR